MRPFLALLSTLLTASALVLLPAATQPQAAPPVAQSPQSTAPLPPHLYFNRNTVFLDPAHGGSDDGARIGDRLLEKDLDLALATRIQAQLASEQGLIVVAAREAADATAAQPPPAPSIDTRAGMANHSRAVGCVLLHATAAGAGVHIVTSTLTPPDPNAPYSTLLQPWATVQAIWVPQSLRLANLVGTSLRQAGVPVYLTHASVRPLDSLACPAIAIEVAPPRFSGGPDTIADPAYQQRIATAIASALVSWRARAEPPLLPQAPAPVRPAPEAVKPAPAVVSPANRNPNLPSAPFIAPPAPVIRRTPPALAPAPVVRRPPAAPVVRAKPATAPPGGNR